MGKQPIGRQDEEYIKASWQWAADTCKAEAAGVRVALVPSQRPGVWEIRAQLVEMADKRAVGIRLQVAQEWPSVNHSTLAGAVLAALMSLDHQIGIDALAQASPVK